MKKIFYILSFLFTLSFASFAQDDEGKDGGKIREKMQEYIQKKLGLSKNEAERFSPVFVEYFKELRRANHEHKGDKLVLRQKVAELRIRYREQFKPVVGEKRSNDVFVHEKEFVDEIIKIRQDRIQNRKEGRANNKSMKPQM